MIGDAHYLARVSGLMRHVTTLEVRGFFVAKDRTSLGIVMQSSPTEDHSGASLAASMNFTRFWLKCKK